MADITVVPADVRPLPGAIIQRFTAAASSMTPGQPVYLSTNNTVNLADATDTTKSLCVGVIVSLKDGGTASVSGDELDVCTFGRVAGYSTNMAVNKLMYVDDDAGVIANATGTSTTIIGIGINGTTMLVNPQWVTLS